MDKRRKLTREDILRIQVQKIRKYKRIMSEKAGQDLGEEKVNDWIDKYASGFRQYWERKLEEVKKENTHED